LQISFFRREKKNFINNLKILKKELPEDLKETQEKILPSLLGKEKRKKQKTKEVPFNKDEEEEEENF